MKFALSTNWCCRRIESGEAIAEKALELGFEALELGFHTTHQQVAGFRAKLDVMPVGSVHAFCPVPISAPQGYPELYQLAAFDDEMRAMARLQVRRNVEFAASMGADAVVLHAGRVMCRGLIRRWDMKRRTKRGLKMVEVFKRELDQIVPDLERNKVTLGLENLPYLEGFPSEAEMKDLAGDWVKPWFDTGHDFVRQTNGWGSVTAPRGEYPPTEGRFAKRSGYSGAPRVRRLGEGVPCPVGLHINDSVGGDDHLVPGQGQVDFAALKPLAESARHIVFEPHDGVTESELAKGLDYLRKLWT